MAQDAPATGGRHVAPQDPKAKKVPLLLRVYGFLCIAQGALSLPIMGAFFGIIAFAYFVHPADIAAATGPVSPMSMILVGIGIVLMIVNAVGLIIFGFSLMKSRRRDTAMWAYALIAAEVVNIVLDIMLAGIGPHLVRPFVELFVLVAISVTIDPTLRRERRAEREAADERELEAARQGMLGRDLTGRGYIELNFFNLFWVFVVCCVIGLLLEIVWHVTVVDPGVYQDRAGMLYGPFSPIYGFGAVFVTIALNRLYNKSLALVFVVSGLVGAAFEYFTSWFMQTAFGAVAWDYSDYTILGQPDPVAVLCDGRTSTMFLCIWGLLGLVWVKALLPMLLRLINLIPWKLRYGLTTACAVLMLVNGLMTLTSLDCWFERVSGHDPQTPVEQFFAEHYDNDFMQGRFESMTITPDDSTRVSAEGVQAAL